MNGYGYSDKLHYDTAGFVDLGRRFTLQMQAVQEKAGE